MKEGTGTMNDACFTAAAAGECPTGWKHLVLRKRRDDACGGPPSLSALRLRNLAESIYINVFLYKVLFTTSPANE